MQAYSPSNPIVPCATVAPKKTPGHWLLARLGKRVLRPGGLAMTRWLIDSLQISPGDDVVEFAPGLGATAKLVLDHCPNSYIGIERDLTAAGQTAAALESPIASCIVGNAQATGLPNNCVSVVIGEAMLSMQSERQKDRIVAEAHRLVEPGGRYAIHELCIQPDDLSESVRAEIERDLSQAIHVQVKPLTAAEWRHLLAMHEFEVVSQKTTSMSLLRPLRMLRDEGLMGLLRVLKNLAKDSAARQRVRQMRTVFHRHRKNLSAIALVARKVSA